ncbi:hypothetical protein EON65_19060 [archaeon]|nr:MAG: hypothetical protein EON65_19060 [archaeon]
MYVFAFLYCLVLCLSAVGCFGGERVQAYKQIQHWMLGQYSNILQSSQDAKDKKPTAAEGGHEHVTCIIEKHPEAEDTLVAQFRFGADINTPPFRYRHYVFSPAKSSPHTTTRMKLYKPSAKSMEKLRQVGFRGDLYMPSLIDCEELLGCDIQWSLQRPFLDLQPSFYLGKLINGLCKLPSQNDPNEIITVKDELKLWSNRLWINDQVYSSSGKLIIGNSVGIPYKFDKQ